MNGAISIGQSLEDDVLGLDFLLYGSPYEGEGSPTLDFPWSHPAGDGRYSPRQNLRTPPREIWDRSTNTGHYVLTNDGFSSGFGLDSDPAQQRTLGQSGDRATTFDATDFISKQQDFLAEGFPDDNKARDITPSERSPASTTSARHTTPTSPTTATGSAGAPDTKQRRERNRVAARKCRKKAKQNLAGLQQREEELSEKNKMLHSHVGGLRDEILDLKNEIFRHSGCNSSMIQDYLVDAARRQS
ncbi:hypothetical protein F4824DRAFT_444944 [Ustulina deusta]|nr:hypothetical protein F4824DRAFT_444944 [Ustulina deusta]